MIIIRYLTKEILWTFFATLTVLLLIALSNRFALYLGKAATGELPLGLIVKVVGLTIPELLSYLIPLSFFIALLFAFGRMYVDSEMTVLMACGISWSYICKLTLIIATIVMLFVGMLSMWWVPKIAKNRDQALSEGESIGMLQSIMPGRFQTDAEGNHVFYLEDISKDHTLQGVFIAERPHSDKPEENGFTLITAEEAFIKNEAKTKDFYLVLKAGHRYQGTPGSANYTVVKFAEYGRAIPKNQDFNTQNELRIKESTHLFDSKNLADIAEFQWRLALPISVPILALLAIPLSRVRPRHGRFAKFLPAIVVYIVYYNLFTVGKRWISNDIVPTYLGIWWVHIIFLGLGLFLLARESGWMNRKQWAWNHGN